MSSKRDALRSFQARLAERLQAARSTGVSASWLAVEAGEGRFLIPLAHAGEIFPWTAAQPVPYTAAWFMGVANLRGGLYGVVQLSAFAGTGTVAPASEALRAQARLVALNELLEVNCALQIDRLVGLRGTEAFQAAEPPAAEAPEWHGHTYTDVDGLRWQELNLQALAQSVAFLSIGA